MTRNFFYICKIGSEMQLASLAKENLTRTYSRTFMGASLLSSSASRRMPLAVLTRRRGEGQDNGKRSMGRCVLTSGTVIPAHVPTTLIYVVAATIIDATLHRSLCLSLSLCLFSLPSLALFSPFPITAWFFSCIIRRQRAFTVDVYQRSAHRKIHGTATLAGRTPHKMVWEVQVTMPGI